MTGLLLLLYSWKRKGLLYFCEIERINRLIFYYEVLCEQSKWIVNKAPRDRKQSLTNCEERRVFHEYR